MIGTLPTICPLCGDLVYSLTDAISFPPIFENEAEPLFLLNDALVHSHCAVQSEIAAEARRRVEIWRQHTDPPICLLCGNAIRLDQPYHVIPYLAGGDPEVLAHAYRLLHSDCATRWPLSGRVVESYERLHRAGLARGRSLEWSIDQLRRK